MIARFLFDGYDTGALLGRMASLAIRFAVPIYVLATASAEALGSFYLFTSFLTFAVFLASFEMSTGFAKTYIRATDSTERALQAFYLVVTQVSMATVVTVLLVVANRRFESVAVLAASAIVSEALVNEVGRFCWNIGRTRLASMRDLVRSVGFGLGIFLSITIEGDPLGFSFFGVLIVVNAALTVADLRLFGVASLLGDWRMLRYACRNVAEQASQTIRSVSWQMVQMQILALIPLMERLALDRAGGVALVAAYSFQYSIMQSGSTLLSMPYVSTFRVAALGASGESATRTRKLMLILIARLSLVAVAAAILTCLVVPVIAAILNKSIDRSWCVTLAALLSSLAGTFSSATSPLYIAVHGVRRNVVSCFCCLPLVIVYILPPQFVLSSSTVLVAISLTAVVHPVSRFGISTDRRSA